MKRTIPIAATALLALLAFPLEAATGSKTSQRKPRARSRPPLSLVWHVETLDGDVVSTSGADDPINPASVVKVATSWWALETLGPEHRFETRFFARGTVDAKRGVLQGDLVVEGGADPDFQAENAFLVAAALNRLGIRRVTGALVVNRRFWMGWEDGSAGRQSDPDRRASLMGARLRQALDPAMWNKATRAAWRSFAVRRGLYAASPPKVAIAGGVRVGGANSVSTELVVHRSKPLAETLRRFNCYSNNDIERVGDSIGPIGDLAARLTGAIGAPPGALRIETASGLGENRLTPRQVVRMMREFRRTGERFGRPVESLLPVGGCDPGTVTRFFPQFAAGENATALVAKTGTLTSTDGGISVLAGFLNTAQGEVIFCVAAPRAAGRLKRARFQEEQWLLGIVAKMGGAEPRTCAPPLAGADDDADVVLTGLATGRPPASWNGGGRASAARTAGAGSGSASAR